MKTHGYVIVEVDESYINEIEIGGGIKLTVNSTIESIEHINRRARVVSAPAFTVLKEGYEVIIHHNICRLRNGIKGELVRSNYHLEGNKYFVPLTEIFCYKTEESDWISIDPYVFVEPIKRERKEGLIVLIDDSESHKGMVRNRGKIAFGNKALEEYGFVKGDIVLFSNNSEYEFIIDGKLYYKMSTKDILGKFE